MAPTRETSGIEMLSFFHFGITNAAVGDMAAGPAFALMPLLLRALCSPAAKHTRAPPWALGLRFIWRMHISPPIKVHFFYRFKLRGRGFGLSMPSRCRFY